MSWFRSAVNKAVEVGGKNPLSRTVRNYADTVVHHAGQAVAEGAKIFQDRFVPRNFRSFKLTIKRLEEVSVSCSGPERVQVLRRWLFALKEAGSLSENPGDCGDKVPGSPRSSDDVDLSPRKTSLVLFYDPEIGGEPMTFHEVFLYSQALEGITMNMILDAPSDEEVGLLLEIFAISLTGGREIHNAIVSGIQDLSKALSSYEEEVLVKREELLQFAQSAITGLKLNADLARINAEALILEQKLYQKAPEPSSADSSEDATSLKDALAEVKMCSILEGLLLKKKLTNIGDSHEIRSQKIDKLKILSDSLASSTIKAEKRISDNRQQKEQAFNFRLSKANEVSEVEKELEAEVAQLEKQRNDIEAELKRVNASLTAVLARLHNAREEKEQFDEANNQIIEHLMKKDADLSKSVVASTVEADVVRTWINFLEDTWILQSSYTEQKERSTNDELEKSVKYFVKLVTKYLGGYKEELEHAIIHIRKCTDTLNKFSDRLAGSSGDDAETRDTILQRKKLEGEYLDAEAKILITFSVVDNIKEVYYSQHGSPVRQNNSEVREAFDALERLRQDYESLLRPPLVSDDESPKEKLQSYTEGRSQNLSHANQPEIEVHPPKNDSLVAATVEAGIFDGVDPEAELAKLESEFGKADIDHSTEEIGGWDFDELEQELNGAETSAGK